MSTWQPSTRARERTAYREGRRRRSFAVALLSTVIVAALAWWVLVTSPGWERARETFFDPAEFVDVLPGIAEGLWLNLRVWIIAGAISIVLGLLLAIARTTAAPALFPLRALVVVYVDIFRGVPVLLVLLLVGFGLPALRLPWLPGNAAFLGSLALVLTYSAYLSEIFRSGIESVHPSQVAAARALGLTRGQTTRRVVVPQAVRNVVPALLNMVVALQKDSGLISVLGAVDAIRVAEIEVTGSYNFTPYVAAGFLFLLVSVPLTRAVDTFNARRGWRGARGPAGGIR
ncbi:amino acid ABC transporter permease [Ruania alba]|uniref:Amino acid ABC transporter membrane protein, PAAT family n=1 Tax=Ruania alba TaxID=648782 RepID=A0A1H5CNJ6_9MICO|nr:amino acid ABC transporter permease [Ruania alba]SED68252.1 amino acid ABC transporter membrane protein, PAAT family [Ruania alba]